MSIVGYGLTPLGFVPKTYTVCAGEIGAAVRGLRGASVDIGDQSLEGQWIKIYAERESLIWDLMQAIVAAYDPDMATSAALDAVSAITGTYRNPALSSKATETLTGAPGTVVPQGSQVDRLSLPGQPFSSTAAATIVALTAWVHSTVYTVGQRVTNGGNAYQCTVSGTSAGSGGPTGGTPGSTITDGGVTWIFLGSGTGAVDQEFDSVTKDAIVAVAYDLVTRLTAVSGWTGAINVNDAALGAPAQLDPSLRISRDDELQSSGDTPADALRSALARVPGVTSVTVYNNQTDVVDGNGQPPHSVQPLISGSFLPGDVGAVLLKGVAGGIRSFGTSPVTVVDSAGNNQTFYYTVPSIVQIYVDITLLYDPSTVASRIYGGDTAVKAALALFGQSRYTGDVDVRASDISRAAFPVLANGTIIGGVQGVLDVVQLLIYTDVIGTPTAWAPTTGYVATVGARSVVTNDGGRTYICEQTGTSAGSGGPTGTGTTIVDGTVHWRYIGATIPISAFQVAALDTSRINVHSSAASEL